jgi:F420-0:gamma-glutamyl ligase
LAVGDGQQVPFLFGPVIARQLHRGPGTDVRGAQARADQNVGEQHFEGAHLRSAGHRATRAGVDSSGVDLSLLLAIPGVPESLHSLLETLLQMG